MTLAELFSTGHLDNPFLLSWLLFKEGGWVIFVIVLLCGFWMMWKNYIMDRYADKREWVLLAIDVPKNNEQTPKAVENFFAQIAGAHSSFTKWDIYWHGKTQDFLSFEIVSLGGKIQYLIRCITRHRDLVEASIYAQYPDAEITEVEDYIKSVPKVFPNETHQLWGVEFLLQNNQCYPIKTYPDFEHIMSKEMKDPLIAILESMLAIGPDEQVWFQIVATPASHNWSDPCRQLINKLLGKTESKGNGILSLINTGLIAETNKQIVYGQTGVDVTEAPKETKPQIPLSLLSPGEYKALEAVQRKSSKWAFQCKIRMIYLGTNESFKISRVVNPIVGAIKQYSDFNTNSLYPDMKKTATRARYMFTKYRIARKQRRIFYGYKARSNYRGRTAYYLNVEELATIFHFPMVTYKGSPVQQTASKKFDAPLATPYERRGGVVSGNPAQRKTLEELKISQEASEEVNVNGVTQEKDAQRTSPLTPPDNLPM